MKVKIFSDMLKHEVEYQINKFLERNKDIHIIDIKFQAVTGNFVTYLAMIIYEEKENKNPTIVYQTNGGNYFKNF